MCLLTHQNRQIYDYRSKEFHRISDKLITYKKIWLELLINNGIQIRNKKKTALGASGTTLFKLNINKSLNLPNTIAPFDSK